MQTHPTVVLVDADDHPLGLADKLDAHRRGALHRAFSVFVFDAGGRTLLQRRAADKYHSGGLWSNACCSHPRPGPDLPAQARARLHEEMGMDCALTTLGTVQYRRDVGGGLVEHELDHVLAGRASALPDPRPAPGEVMDWRWVAWARFVADLRAAPQRYTAWLAPIVDHLGAELGTFAHTPPAARP